MATISCVVNCYNGETYLRQALDSIFAQTYKDWEVIFIDNCSSDASAEIAKSYGEKVKYICLDEKLPLYAARNIALDNASGEVVTFLDVDDLWLPDFLQTMYEAIQDGNSFVFCGTSFIDKNNNPLEMKHPSQSLRSTSVNQMLLRNVIPMGGVMVRRDLFLNHRFNPELNIVGDHDMWLMLAVDGHVPVHVGKTLAVCRHHDSNLTLLSPKMVLSEERAHAIQFFKDHGLRYPFIVLYGLKALSRIFLSSRGATRKK